MLHPPVMVSNVFVFMNVLNEQNDKKLSDETKKNFQFFKLKLNLMN